MNNKQGREQMECEGSKNKQKQQWAPANTKRWDRVAKHHHQTHSPAIPNINKHAHRAQKRQAQSRFDTEAQQIE